MSHVRAQVRDEIVTALAGIPGLNTQAQANRINPIAAGGLPAVFVVITDEAIETLTMGWPRTQLRVMTVFVDVVIQQNDDFDDALDGFAVTIERRLGQQDPFPLAPAGFQVKDIILVNALKALDGASETDTARLRMEYQVSVHTRENDPETLVGE